MDLSIGRENRNTAKREIPLETVTVETTTLEDGGESEC